MIFAIVCTCLSHNLARPYRKPTDTPPKLRTGIFHCSIQLLRLELLSEQMAKAQFHMESMGSAFNLVFLSEVTQCWTVLEGVRNRAVTCTFCVPTLMSNPFTTCISKATISLADSWSRTTDMTVHWCTLVSQRNACMLLWGRDCGAHSTGLCLMYSDHYRFRPDPDFRSRIYPYRSSALHVQMWLAGLEVTGSSLAYTLFTVMVDDCDGRPTLVSEPNISVACIVPAVPLSS